MNRKYIQAFAAVAVLALAAFAPCSASAAVCTNKMLAGAYGVTVQGTSSAD